MESKPPIIKCYSNEMSNCSQIVRLCLTECNLEYKRIWIDIMQNMEQYDKWYARINPRMMVPCIEYNGEVILDSKNIIWEMMKRHPSDLGPKNSEEKAKMDHFINSFYEKFNYIVGFTYQNIWQLSIFHKMFIIKNKFITSKSKLEALKKDPEFTEIVEWKIKQQMEMKDGAMSKSREEIDEIMREEVIKMEKALSTG